MWKTVLDPSAAVCSASANTLLPEVVRAWCQPRWWHDVWKGAHAALALQVEWAASLRVLWPHLVPLITTTLHSVFLGVSDQDVASPDAGEPSPARSGDDEATSVSSALSGVCWHDTVDDAREAS